MFKSARFLLFLNARQGLVISYRDSLICGAFLDCSIFPHGFIWGLLWGFYGAVGLWFCCGAVAWLSAVAVAVVRFGFCCGCGAVAVGDIRSGESAGGVASALFPLKNPPFPLHRIHLVHFTDRKYFFTLKMAI